MEEAAQAVNESTYLLARHRPHSVPANNELSSLPSNFEDFLALQPIALRIYLLSFLLPHDIITTACTSRTMRAAITKPGVLTALQRLHVMRFWTTPESQNRLRQGVSVEASFLGGTHATRCRYGRHYIGNYEKKTPDGEELTREKMEIARQRSEILFQKNLLISREILSAEILNSPDVTKYFFLFTEYLRQLFKSRNMSIALLAGKEEILTEQEVRFLFPHLSTKEINLGLLIRLDHLEFLLRQFYQNTPYKDIFLQTARETILLAYHQRPCLVDITTAIQQSPLPQRDHQGTQILYGFNESTHKFVTEHRTQGPYVRGRPLCCDEKIEAHGTASCNALGCLSGILGCIFPQSCSCTGPISGGCFAAIITHRFIVGGLADLVIGRKIKKLAGQMSHNFRYSGDCTAFFAPAGSLHRARPDIFENCLTPLGLEPEPLDPDQFNRNGGRSQTYVLGLGPQ